MTTTYYRLTPRPHPRLLSLVIPAYNEQEMLPLLRREVTEFLATFPCEAEVVVVNDGSSDRTLDLLLDWADADRRIKVLGLARNFGHQAAVTAGLDAARGDAVVILDADLQDPLHLIRDMVREYCRGYDVVYGQRMARPGESLFKRVTAWAFYRLMRRLIHEGLPPDTGDFRLISRACLEALSAMRETHRFLRGMVAWVGFPQTAVAFTRQPRAAGQTKYPLRKMIRFAWTGAVSFSPAPLRISLGLGIVVALFGLIWGLYAVVLPLWGGQTVRGWSSTVVLLSLIGGAILFSIGILGEYVGRIFEEIKGRPLYVVAMQVNLETERMTAERQAAGDGTGGNRPLGRGQAVAPPAQPGQRQYPGREVA
jgi:polyisoprenyl-phosphate glycosyltransferase